MKTYHCTIVYDNTPHEWTHFCSGPIYALNEFHRRAQKTKEVGFDRTKVQRRMLKPDEYAITALWCDGVNYDDLPRSGNPDLNKPKQAKPVIDEFAGMPAQGEGRLST